MDLRAMTLTRKSKTLTLTLNPNPNPNLQPLTLILKLPWHEGCSDDEEEGITDFQRRVDLKRWRDSGYKWPMPLEKYPLVVVQVS